MVMFAVWVMRISNDRRDRAPSPRERRASTSSLSPGRAARQPALFTRPQPGRESRHRTAWLSRSTARILGAPDGRGSRPPSHRSSGENAMNATATTPAAPFATRNDLKESTRAQVAELLNRRLADAIDLQTQSKQAHWNVKGPNFIALHKLFDEIHASVTEYADLLAE